MLTEFVHKICATITLSGESISDETDHVDVEPDFRIFLKNILQRKPQTIYSDDIILVSYYLEI